MACSCREAVRAVSGAHAVGRAEYHRRTLVVRLIAEHARGGGVLVLLPGLLEFLPIALRAVAVEEIPVGVDARGDEIFRRVMEDRTPLFGVRAQQRVAAPAVEPGGELPSEIGRVVEPAVEAVSAIGRMAVGGIA